MAKQEPHGTSDPAVRPTQTSLVDHIGEGALDPIWTLRS
jgi:hypothetical protein